MLWEAIFGKFGLLPSLGRLAGYFHQSLVNEHHSKAFQLTCKRLLILFVFACLLPMLLLWNHIGCVLDDLLFPAWSQQPVLRPVFIIGNARSGSTWLHRLLAQDEGVTSFRTWELLLAVSITWKMLFNGIYRADRYMGGAGLRVVLMVERWVLGRGIMHEVGLLLVEEDEWLLTWIGRSQLLLFLFPTVSTGLVWYDCVESVLREFPRNNNTSTTEEVQSALLKVMKPYCPVGLELTSDERVELFVYYKQCIQRHLYYSNMSGSASRVFVAKNPTFTLRLFSLKKVFPDAQIVCLLRDPVVSVASMVSYIQTIWGVWASPCPLPATAAGPAGTDEMLLAFCLAHYLFPLLLKDIRYISYSAMRRDLAEALNPLLADLGLRLLAQGSGERYQSEHKYAPMDQHLLRERLALVYATHGAALQ